MPSSKELIFLARNFKGLIFFISNITFLASLLALQTWRLWSSAASFFFAKEKGSWASKKKAYAFAALKRIKGTQADNGMIGACGGPFSFSRERKAPWDQKKEAGDFQSPKSRFQKQKALDPSPIRLPFFLLRKERLPGIQRKKRSGFQPLKDAIAYENLGSRPFILNTTNMSYYYG
ncbi:MAG TPA: hypothetical protein HA224_04400 [Nanoarchaeota archaeon]|nr:hypothetical protein [Nanoarchaeota archaeon]